MAVSFESSATVHQGSPSPLVTDRPGSAGHTGGPEHMQDRLTSAPARYSPKAPRPALQLTLYARQSPPNIPPHLHLESPTVIPMAIVSPVTLINHWFTIKISRILKRQKSASFPRRYKYISRLL